jgi:predicted GIY-YIG superfamily endonuclease
MHYCYILLSSKSHIFYFGSANDLRERLKFHNSGKVKSTKSHIPWKLVWYSAFETEKQARDFEQYLKTGSEKAFAYKRFVSVALKKDFFCGKDTKVIRSQNGAGYPPPQSALTNRGKSLFFRCIHRHFIQF